MWRYLEVVKCPPYQIFIYVYQYVFVYMPMYINSTILFSSCFSLLYLYNIESLSILKRDPSSVALSEVSSIFKFFFLPIRGLGSFSLSILNQGWIMLYAVQANVILGYINGFDLTYLYVFVDFLTKQPVRVRLKLTESYRHCRTQASQF